MNQRDPLTGALEQNADDLLRYFLRRLRNREDAADSLSETMLTAWKRRRHQPAISTEIRPWLYGIARNVLMNQYRVSARATRFAQGLRDELNATTAQHADFTSDLATTSAVTDAIAKLAPQDAELVRLVHWDGLSVADAAIVLAIPASTARSRYARIKEQLRTSLQPLDAETSR